MRSLSLITGAAIIVGTAATNSVVAQDICTALLQGGIFDTTETNSSKFAADYYRSRRCSSGQSDSNAGFNIGIPIDDVPVQFGASSADKNSYNICDDRNSSLEAWQKYFAWSSKVSPTLAKAFNDCIKNVQGAQLWTERSIVSNAFSIKARVHYNRMDVPPTEIEISFTPDENVGTCGPKTKGQLKSGIKIANESTFKVDCRLLSQSEGVEIGLVSSVEISSSTLSVRPYRPIPLIALSTTAAQRDGVKVQVPGDAGYQWGYDTLGDRWDGSQIIAPSSGTRWASWRFNGVTPGVYEVLITYAAAMSRPLRLRVNDKAVLENIASDTTGAPPVEGWKVENRQQFNAGQVKIDRPSVNLRLEAMAPGQSWPHFKEMRLVFVSDLN